MIFKPCQDLDISTRDKNRITDSKVNDSVSLSPIALLSRFQPQLTAMALEGASEALAISLQALSLQLRKLSSCANLDSNSIGITADAIGKVAQALSQVGNCS